MLNIDYLRTLNKAENIALTKHAKDRLAERLISIDDVLNCIDTGEIIKQYQDDKPLPSCLILGVNSNNLPLHIVVSHDESFIYLITAYLPDTNVWKKDFKIKKEG